MKLDVEQDLTGDNHLNSNRERMMILRVDVIRLFHLVLIEKKME